MLADALAQYLVWKQWRRWFLIVGSHSEDRLYGDALRRSAKRFGARIARHVHEGCDSANRMQAHRRPGIVATKSADQLDLQALHRVRERLVGQR
jgi:hypothetical protein